jgi:hypothetical protein
MAALVGEIITVLDAVDPNIILAVSLAILVSAGVMIYKRLRR